MNARRIFVLLLAALVLGEVALRVLTGADSRWNMRLGAHKQLDPIAQFRNKPNYDLGGVTTNSLGYQAPEPLTIKPAQASLRLIYLGDSNSVMPLLSSYPRQVEAILEPKLERDVETVNAAVPGYSSQNAVKLFEHELSKFAGDYFFVYLGWNDLGQYGPEGFPYKRQETGYQVSAAQRGLSQLFLLRYAFALPSLLDRERRAFDSPLDERERRLYSAYSPRHFEENLARILSLAKQRYPHVFVMNLATLTNGDPTEDELARAHFPNGMGKNMRKLDSLVAKYNESVARVTLAQRVPMIDLFREFDSHEARVLFTDSCHMNREGAARIAQLIANEVVASERLAVRR